MSEGPKFARIKEEGRYTNQIVSVLDNMVGVQKVSFDKDSNKLKYDDPIAINKDEIEETTEFDGEEGQKYLKTILEGEPTGEYSGGARKSRKARKTRKARKARKARKTRKH
jgi:hypothetical protein